VLAAVLVEKLNEIGFEGLCVLRARLFFLVLDADVADALFVEPYIGFAFRQDAFFTQHGDK
jgi:hypothetical protein